MRKAAFALCLSVATALSGAAQACGTESLAGLARILGVDIPRSDLAAMRQSAGGPLSLADIRREAQRYGIELVGVQCELPEFAGVRGPAIIHLNDPDHFVLLLNQSPDSPQILDQGVFRSYETEKVLERFSGKALIVAQQEGPPGPRLHTPRPVHEQHFEHVGDDLVVEFPIENTGSAALEVKVVPVCGLDATSDKDALLPGETGIVVVRKSRSRAGRFDDRVYLETNDPYRRVGILSVCGSIGTELRVYTDKVDITVPSGARGLRLVGGEAPSGTALRAATDLGGCLELRFDEVRDDGVVAWWNLLIRTLDGVRPGRTEGTVRVYSEGHEEHGVDLAVTLHVRSALVVRPQSVFGGLVRRGTDAGGELEVRRWSDSPFRILGVEASDPRIEVTFEETERGYRLMVSIPTDELGVFKGEITVTTDVPLEEPIKIPVYAHVVE